MKCNYATVCRVSQVVAPCLIGTSMLFPIEGLTFASSILVKKGAPLETNYELFYL